MNAPPDSQRIGPGALVLVVGPSGAGKDTLIGLIRARYADNPTIVFPRRTVTRVSSSHEDHDSMTDLEFERSAASGAFSLAWRAHGLRYGIPSRIDADIRKGRTIVCNVSRHVVAEARLRYERCSVVLVTAPDDVLLERLVRRGRSTDGSTLDRLARAAPPLRNLAPDLVLENIGDPADSATKLHAFIDGLTPRI